MSRLPQDLLDHARRLCELDPAVQTNIGRRRAVSAAYYALFHKLADETALLFTTASTLPDPVRENLAGQIRRMLSHTELRDHADKFQGTDADDLAEARPPRHTPKKFIKDLLAEQNPAVPPELRRFATIFCDLQDARELADYVRDQEVSPAQARKYVQDADVALDHWEKIRLEPIAQVFLAALLLEKKGRR